MVHLDVEQRVLLVQRGNVLGPDRGVDRFWRRRALKDLFAQDNLGAEGPKLPGSASITEMPGARSAKPLPQALAR